MQHESNSPKTPRTEVVTLVGISAWLTSHFCRCQVWERLVWGRKIRTLTPSFQSVKSAPTETDWPFKYRGIF